MAFGASLLEVLSVCRIDVLMRDYLWVMGVWLGIPLLFIYLDSFQRGNLVGIWGYLILRLRPQVGPSTSVVMQKMQG